MSRMICIILGQLQVESVMARLTNLIHGSGIHAGNIVFTIFEDVFVTL